MGPGVLCREKHVAHAQQEEHMCMCVCMQEMARGQTVSEAGHRQSEGKPSASCWPLLCSGKQGESFTMV